MRSPAANDERRHRLAAWGVPLTVRLADGDDLDELATLAGRDSVPLPPGPWLVAERRGRIDAALSLASGEAIADPFARTAELVEVLRAYRAGVRANEFSVAARPDEPRAARATRRQARLVARTAA